MTRGEQCRSHLINELQRFHTLEDLTHDREVVWANPNGGWTIGVTAAECEDEGGRGSVSYFAEAVHSGVLTGRWELESEHNYFKRETDTLEGADRALSRLILDLPF